MKPEDVALLELERIAFREVLGADEGSRNRSQRVVLAAFARFCHAQDSTFDAEGNPFRSAFFEGQRNVWTHLIRYRLDLTDEEIEAGRRYLRDVVQTALVGNGGNWQ